MSVAKHFVGGVSEGRSQSLRSLLTPYQWLVLGVAWLGWVFDSMDATIYSLVLGPALKEFLGPQSSAEAVGWYGGIIFAIFLVGWALGGVVFGVLADYFGRARTLVITILFALISFGIVALSSNVRLSGAGAVHVNSPYAISMVQAALNQFYMLAAAAIVANVVVRDYATGYGQLIFSTPISKLTIRR